MGLSSGFGAAVHDAMHRLPGMPDHTRAGDVSAHQHQRGLRNRPLRNPDGHHGRPPRVFAGWQAWLGQRFGRGHR